MAERVNEDREMEVHYVLTPGIVDKIPMVEKMEAMNQIDELCTALRHALAVIEFLRTAARTPNQHLNRIEKLEDRAQHVFSLYRPEQPLRDKCEVCHGWRGGVPGNENIVNGVALCDDCTVDAGVQPEGLE